jgi:hypothetical protein
VFAGAALFASAGFGERITALQFGQFLFQVHGRDYNQRAGDEGRIAGSPHDVTGALASLLDPEFQLGPDNVPETATCDMAIYHQLFRYGLIRWLKRRVERTP